MYHVICRVDWAACQIDASHDAHPMPKLKYVSVTSMIPVWSQGQLLAAFAIAGEEP